MTAATSPVAGKDLDIAKLAISIAHWEDEETSRECLAHLASAGVNEARWILVDNGSRDGSGERLRARYPGLVYIRNELNLGHAAAVNQGARKARELGCEFLLLLDNDAFVSPASVRELFRVFAERNDAGIVSPRILSGRRPGKIWYDGGSVTLLGKGRHEHMWRQSDDVERTTRIVEFATACAMMVRLEAFFAAGGFDEQLITYADDLDFSFRVRRNGYEIVHVPAAEVTHGESRNVIAKGGKQFRDYFNMRNQLLVQWRYGNILQRVLGIPVTIMTDGIVRAVAHALRGDLARLRALALGTADFLRGKTGWGSL